LLSLLAKRRLQAGPTAMATAGAPLAPKWITCTKSGIAGVMLFS